MSPGRRITVPGAEHDAYVPTEDPGSRVVERPHWQHFATRRKAKDDAIALLLLYNQNRLQSTFAYVNPVRFG